jgi:rhodanese-related sulfurtransferase
MNLTNDPKTAEGYFAAKMAFTTGPVELDGMIRRGEVNVVDVRSEKDFTAEHIPGSVNLPRSKWGAPEGVVKDKTNVVLCYSQVCHLGAAAAMQLAKQGFPVMELEGGFAGWKAHRLPTERPATTEEERTSRSS